MANIRLIKRRIRSAKNIAQITKAMEMVAASKMRKAQAAALGSKLYATKIYDMVMKLSSSVDISHHPLLAKPKTITGKRLVLCLSTNKGLCGGLNTNLFRFLMQSYGKNMSTQSFVTIGRKGADFLSRMGATLLADFSSTIPFVQTAPAVTELLTKTYVSGGIDAVDVVWSEFVSVVQQVPMKKTILPLTIAGSNLTDTEPIFEYVIEPDAKSVLNLLLPHYLENQIRNAIIQSEASEHSAMRQATDNARSFMEELTLLYNKARQEKITYEISDMVTARLAVQGI